MNAHTKLTMHLTRHMYKKGAHKGEAPLDGSKRGKTRQRVIKGNGGQMIVRMHNTDVLTAYEDGRIVLRANGWESSPTTRQCINEALCFAGFGSIGSVRKWGMSNTVIRVGTQSWLYYDGMEFSAEGKLLSTPLEFEKRVSDREETKEFRADIKESGFVDMFPVLFAAATSDMPFEYMRSVTEAMSSEHYAHHWPYIAARSKFGTKRYYSHRVAHYENHKDALQALVASITKNMKVIIKSGVTVL